MHYGHALLDIETFYDSMPWLPLVEAALRLDFPPVVLHLELVQCIAPRVLEQMGAATDPFEPSQSAVQGLRSGTRFAKALAHFVMAHVTTMHPRMGHR
eukprot:4592328-Pyramimonas_sp.AAC.1